MLLVNVEVLVERGWRQANSFRDQRRKEYRDLAHAGDVLAVHGLEVWEVRGGGPLCRRKEITVERLIGGSNFMVCRKIDLFAVVYCVCCDFGIEARVS